MRKIIIIVSSFIAFLLIAIIIFLVYINWPSIQNKYYLHRAEKLGNCYYYYKEQVEFVTGFEEGNVSRHPLKQADFSTFRVVGLFCDSVTDCFQCAIWAKDSERVFWKAELLYDADPYTFSPISASGYSKDHIHVFYKSKNITVANPSTFTLISDDFARDNRFVYYKEKPLTQVQHPESFEILDHYCWRDDSLVYLNGEILPEAHPASFQLLDVKEYKGKFKFFVYKDHKNGYILDLNKDIYQRSIMKDNRKIFIIENIDAQTFEPSEHKYYTFDKNNVYFKDRVIADVHPKTFHILGQFYGMQDDLVYFKDSVLQNADYNSIEIKGHLLAIDKNYAFYEGHVIKDVNIDKIKALNDYYLTDGTNIYYKWEKINNADPETFKIINKHLKHEAKDKNHNYRKGKVFSRKTSY